jgi:hypothetical protein
MLPMLYAPLAGGEVPESVFQFALPMLQEEGVLNIAFEMAKAFWSAAAKDGRITFGFSAICEENLNALTGLHQRLSSSPDSHVSG